MILKFDNGYNEREIGLPQSEQEAFQIMKDFMNERNYKSYYIRSWTHENVTTLDVGSWTQFVKLYLND